MRTARRSAMRPLVGRLTPATMRFSSDDMKTGVHIDRIACHARRCAADQKCDDASDLRDIDESTRRSTLHRRVDEFIELGDAARRASLERAGRNCEYPDVLI